MEPQKRESNIELLRILTIIGVIVLHYNNKLIGGGLEYVFDKSINFYILNILESIFIPAVNIFIIISGLFLYKTEKRNLWKVIKLLIQVMVIYECKYIVSSLLNKNSISITKMIFNLIPSNYFVVLYIVVYILSPYINILIKSLDKKESKRLLLVLFVIFSVYPTAIDFLSEITKRQYNGLSSIGMYGSQYGYTCVNFVLCYIIGAYISKYKSTFEKNNFKQLASIFIINVVLITMWTLFNDYTGYFIEKSALEYCNPIIIINAAVIVIMFMKMNIRTNIVINNLAKASFTVFLVHNIFMKKLSIESFVNKNSIIMILHIIVSVCTIYSICWMIWYIYNKIEKYTLNKLESKINLNYTIENGEKFSEKI